VTVEQRVYSTASGDLLAVELYSAAPMFTDTRGDARVCDPATLLPTSGPDWQGIGGGYVDHDPGTITVRKGDATLSRRGPFGADPVLFVLPASRADVPAGEVL